MSEVMELKSGTYLNIHHGSSDIVATLHMKERRCRVANDIESKTKQMMSFFILIMLPDTHHL